MASIDGFDPMLNEKLTNYMDQVFNDVNRLLPKPIKSVKINGVEAPTIFPTEKIFSLVRKTVEHKKQSVIDEMIKTLFSYMKSYKQTYTDNSREISRKLYNDAFQLTYGVQHHENMSGCFFREANDRVLDETTFYKLCALGNRIEIEIGENLERTNLDVEFDE